MKINAQTLEGNWNEIKGKLRERWGQVSQDELQSVKGNVEQLVGLIERKTGEARHDVESYLNKLTSEGASQMGKAMNYAKDYADHAMESMEGVASNVADYAREGYDQTERMIRDRPFESLATGFGAGLVTGLILGIVMRSK